MEKSFYSIFKTFFKVGTLLLGGGYVILPLLTSELVDKKKWITSDELCEYYALGASLPGIIAANTAIFTGRKLLGTKGAIAAIAGIITPAFLAIVLLASILSEIVENPTVQHIFLGCRNWCYNPVISCRKRNVDKMCYRQIYLDNIFYLFGTCLMGQNSIISNYYLCTCDRNCLSKI